jgi:plastocyanin
MRLPCFPFRLAAAAALQLTLAASLAVPALAANHTVVTGPGANLTYSPSSLTITAGDTVTFQNTSEGDHNVVADDGSFRCANGCDGDGHGGNGDPSMNAWSFTRTFSTPGRVGFHCEVHGSMGMVGTITVNPAAGSAGSLGFTQSAYAALDSSGSAAIGVRRTGGSSGAVSVHFATSDGTGVAGTNYQAASGTLSWAAGDSAVKTFSVPVLDDGKPDGDHTVNLTLSAPSGGASLASPQAVLTVSNNNTANVPAAPTNLVAAPVDTADVHLTWTVNSANDSDLRVQSRMLGTGTFEDVLPLLPAGTASLTVSGLQPATGYGFRVRAENAAGDSAYTAEVDTATPPVPGPCVADANTLCLGTGGRFKVTVSWMTAQPQSGPGSAVPLAANPDSGLFYFFDQSNIEMLIKVLNACAPPFNAYWVFFAATTNVEFTVTVVDTQANQTRVYTNALNQAAVPVQDTAAFLSCP